jgi:plastocyanin
MPRTRATSLAIACAALLLAGVVLGGCGKDDNTAAPSDCTKIAGDHYTLVAENLLWNTECLRVRVGQKVTFTVDMRDQDVKHNLHIYGPSGNEKTPLENGPKQQTLVFTFSVAGVHQFVCDIHSTMEGRIFVEDKA